MRIVHVLRAPVGGLFRHVLDLARAQARLGHDVGLIVGATAADPLTDGRLAAIAPALALGIATVAMPRLPGIGDIAASRFVHARAGALHLDVLHGHGAKGGAYARLAGRARSAIRVFYTPHGGSLHFKPGTVQSFAFLTLERLLEPFTDGLIFESAYAARVYAQRVQSPRVASRVIHNGLASADFAAVAPAADAADLLFVGELRAVKGVDVLLRALADLNAVRQQPLTAVIVGSGPDAVELQTLAGELGLAAHVRFTGALPVAQALPLGRVMVVPSRAESLPYVVLEAAAAGLPLIATDVGGIGEIVAGTDTALIPAGDQAALARMIAMVTGDPVSAQSRAARLKSSVAAGFTVERMTADVLAFYEACHAAQPSLSSAPGAAPAPV